MSGAGGRAAGPGSSAEAGPPRAGRGAVRGREVDRGAGTVLVLGLVAAVVTLAALLGVLARAEGDRWRAQAAADLASLAAASLLVHPPGVVVLDPAAAGPEPCSVAAEVAARNGAVLARCAVRDGVIVQVTAVRRSVLGDATATARAGPTWARAGPGSVRAP